MCLPISPLVGYTFLVASNTVTQEHRETKTTVSFPEYLWDLTKKAAVDRKTTAQALCIEGLRIVLGLDPAPRRAKVEKRDAGE